VVVGMVVVVVDDNEEIVVEGDEEIVDADEENVFVSVDLNRFIEKESCC